MSFKTDNRTNGGRFEQELAGYLYGAGFWVHVLQQNKAGQPADIIAAWRQYTTLIDCKVISNDRGFPLRRVEENQRYAMARFSASTGYMCWFAMKLPDDDDSVYMISNMEIKRRIRDGEKTISEEDIRKAYTLKDWICEVQERYDTLDEIDEWKV